MNEISVYKQLTAAPDDVFNVLKQEIGMKTNCMPFAAKLITAMKSLTIKTEQESYDAANVLMSGLQTLSQGGIIPEDYDKIDFVKRGKTIVPSARVEAFLRAAARKGYRITDTIIAVPKEDKDTTYFKENLYNGEIIYTLEDMRKNPDRAITAKRLIDKYFEKFLCRLEIADISKGKRILMTVDEMSIEDMLRISCASEQGIYKSQWVEHTNEYGYTKKRKEITNELNSGTFWVNWTGEMVKKTIIRRALKRVKEVLPELTDTIYAFDNDEYQEPQNTPQDPIIDIPVKEVNNVNLNNLTEEQKADCKEIYDLFRANPKLANDKAEEIKQMFENGESKQEIINKEYASIDVLRRSKTQWKKIGGYFK